MRFFSFFLAFLVTVFFPLNASSPSANSAQQPVITKIIEAWEGKFADGTPLTRKKLEELLATHWEWLETSHWEETFNENWEADQGRLVLKEADLTGANLQGADLLGANLQGANLGNANLQGADLKGANLRETALLGTNLREADLLRANLQGARLQEANLQGARLEEANLQGAGLGGANLQGALYEPKAGALPDIVQLRSVSHLETLRFIRSPHGLEELKQAFKKAGMRQQEQEITHAIKRSEQENAWEKGDFLESLFNLVFFDLPVGYGLYPGRALKILASLIPLFAVFYGWVICRPSRNHGIYRLWPKERIEVTEDEPGMANDVKIERLNPKSWRIVTHALYFSLLSTFNIGWRELNVGNWISRLQLHPYTLQATGWVRATSGIQSLISVYLLAIWALTYFGRPFE
jgi:Pentapeptide repeats (8 copies)